MKKYILFFIFISVCFTQQAGDDGSGDDEARDGMGFVIIDGFVCHDDGENVVVAIGGHTWVMEMNSVTTRADSDAAQLAEQFAGSSSSSSSSTRDSEDEEEEQEDEIDPGRDGQEIRRELGDLGRGLIDQHQQQTILEYIQARWRGCIRQCDACCHSFIGCLRRQRRDQ